MCLRWEIYLNIAGSLFGNDGTDEGLSADLQDQATLVEENLHAQGTVSEPGLSPGFDAVLAIVLVLGIFATLAAVLVCCGRVMKRK